MADQKITELDAFVTLATSDLVVGVDISDSTMAASGTNKKITVGNLFRSVPAGTEAAPGLAVTGDPDTGLFSDTADTLSIAVGAVEALRLTESGGNVSTRIQSGGRTTNDASSLVVENTDTNDAGVVLKAGAKLAHFLNDHSRNSILVKYGGSENNLSPAVNLAEFKSNGDSGQLLLNDARPDFTPHALIVNDSGGGAICFQDGDTFDWFGFYMSRPVDDEIDFAMKDRDDNIIWQAAVRTRNDPRWALFGATPVSRQDHIADVPTAGSATAADNATAINAILAALEAYGLLKTS